MMGLFSKKTLVCQRCGKEFQSRLGFADLCAECVLEEEKKGRKSVDMSFMRKKYTEIPIRQKNWMKLQSTDGRSWKSTGQREFLW